MGSNFIGGDTTNNDMMNVIRNVEARLSWQAKEYTYGVKAIKQERPLLFSPETYNNPTTSAAV
jgi:hypothetical protein